MVKNMDDISILDQIETAFLEALRDNEHFDAPTLESLQALIGEGSLDHAERLRAVFEDSEGIAS